MCNWKILQTRSVIFYRNICRKPWKIPVSKLAFHANTNHIFYIHRNNTPGEKPIVTGIIVTLSLYFHYTIEKYLYISEYDYTFFNVSFAFLAILKFYIYFVLFTTYYLSSVKLALFKFCKVIKRILESQIISFKSISTMEIYSLEIYSLNDQ